MMAEKKRQNLGRGLDALLGEASKATVGEQGLKGSRQVPVERLHPGRYQPRHSMDEEKIEELAQSVRENGILQPLLVRRHPDKDDAYEIIAGERRWRAAQMAKVHEVPVVVRELSDQEALEIGLVENLQRQDLSPLEEADGYQRLVDEFSHTQEILSKTVGKSRSHVANMMRLLGLPEPVKQMLDKNELTAGHARALLNAPDPLGSARQVLKQGLNVRQPERLVKKKQRQIDAPPAAPKKDVDTLALERDLANLLGLKVAIKFKGMGGSMTIKYDSLEQLDDILRRLGHGGGAAKGAAIEKLPEREAKKKPASKKPPKLSIGLKSARKKKKKAS
ncbi:MAG: ParB/RepB/Spo0J family partition protein [Rhodospirillales bacterium]